MYSLFYREGGLSHLALVGMFIFLGVFVAVLVRLYSKRAASYDAVAALPLIDDFHSVPKNPGESHGH